MEMDVEMPHQDIEWTLQTSSVLHRCHKITHRMNIREHACRQDILCSLCSISQKLFYFFLVLNAQVLSVCVLLQTQLLTKFDAMENVQHVQSFRRTNIQTDLHTSIQNSILIKNICVRDGRGLSLSAGFCKCFGKMIALPSFGDWV